MGRGELLVETGWLADHLNDSSVRIVDIRGIIKPVTEPPPWYFNNRAAYERSHVHGAVYVDWLQDLVDHDAPIKMTPAPSGKLAQVLGSLGLGDGHTIVVYDDDGGLIACRLWWLLNYYGHSAVKLLNGGWTKWAAESRPVTAEPPSHPPAIFTPRLRPEWRIGPEEVRNAIGVPGVKIVDARSRKEYRGEVSRGELKGRVPTAVNVFFRNMTEGEHKTWKSEAEIRKLFDEAGVTPGQRVICYCNAGVSAAVDLFALKLAGYPDAVNFAGSWYEWESDPSNPIEAGS